MARTEDPKRTKARARRDAAETRAAVIAKGIGQMLSEDSCRWSENLRRLIAMVNLDLASAVAELEEAEKAYEPYWRRGRHRRVSIRPPKKKAKAA